MHQRFKIFKIFLKLYGVLNVPLMPNEKANLAKLDQRVFSRLFASPVDALPHANI